jgi:hypothetical protein
MEVFTMMPPFLLPLIATLIQTPGGLERLNWIAGCWEGRTGNRIYTEQWMKPAAGLMLGMSRTVTGDRVTAFEFLQIRDDGSGMSYVAKPSGQAEASFKLLRQSDREVVFENPQHDFPQRITYRLQPDGSLLARIEGKLNGADRASDFSMKPAACP